MITRHRTFKQRGARGFTLVELVAAMAAGLFVAVGAMVLSRNATRFFQNETRITHTQLAVNLGMSRFAADLQRAAFLSTPNVAADPLRCGATAGWPVPLQRLAGISIVENGSEVAHTVATLQQSVDNNMHPDSIVIGGAFSTTEQFPVRTINREVAGYTVFLSLDNGAMARTLDNIQQGAEPLCPTAVGQPAIFRPGRFVRIIDRFGFHLYSVITACDDTDLADVQITLSQNPPLPEKTNITPCGLSQDLMTGLVINPVSRVLYDIRSLKQHATYGGLVAPPPGLQGQMSGDGAVGPGAAGRTELVRVELDDQGAEVPATLELVAEYAVDFKFGITATNANGPNPTLVKTAIGAAGGYTTAAPLGNAGSNPHLIRAVAVRFSTRARAPDRNDAPTLPGPRPVGEVGRFQLGAVPGPDRDVDGKNDVWARMRTLIVELSLPNQASTQW